MFSISERIVFLDCEEKCTGFQMNNVPFCDIWGKSQTIYMYIWVFTWQKQTLVINHVCKTCWKNSTQSMNLPDLFIKHTEWSMPIERAWSVSGNKFKVKLSSTNSRYPWYAIWPRGGACHANHACAALTVSRSCRLAFLFFHWKCTQVVQNPWVWV